MVNDLKKKSTGFLNDFKEFALKGNVLNLAVGVIIGASFGKIVTSLVEDIFMPVIGLITGGVDVSGAFLALDGGSYASLKAAADAGAPTLNYGSFLQNIIDFALVALCIFLMIRFLSKLARKKTEPAAPAVPAPTCPFCKSEIAEGATRCPRCTSQL